MTEAGAPAGRALRVRLAEVFAAGNLAFLAVDILLAHSVNAFAHPLEWVPFGFSLLATLLLLPGLFRADPTRGPTRGLGTLVGASAVVVGVLGLVLHLHGAFFAEQTLKNLVYTAPFAAPLAYAGVGLLLLLDRSPEVDRPEWGGWVVFLGLGGFVGNLALSLCDHAQNGFFATSEWIPVAAAGYAVAALLVALGTRVGDGYLALCLGLMGVEALVGVLGFGLHLQAILADPAGRLFDRVVYGAPPFAPLLFADLALLTALGLWDLRAGRRGAPHAAPVTPS